MAAVADMKPWVGIILAGVVARVVVIALCGGLHPQALEPSVIAANLNAGRGFTFEQYGAVYHAWKEPLYIGLLAILTRWFGEHPLPLLLFQGMFGVATAVGVAIVARRILGDATKATVAGVIASANPFLVFYDTQRIHPLSMDAFLFIATTGAVLVAVMGQGARWRQSLVAGLVTGLALWQRATLLAAAAMSWCAAVIRAPAPHRARRALSAGCSLILALLVVSPWLIRNYRVLGRWAVTTDAAHVFWLGNNPWSNGTYSDDKGRRVFYVADEAFQRHILGASELEQYDRFREAAGQFIVQQPARFAGLVLGRLKTFFWFSPNSGLLYTTEQKLIYQIAYVGLLSLGLVGLAGFWTRATESRRYEAGVIIAGVLGLAAAHSVIVMNLKHRVPLELVLAIFAAEGLVRGLTVLRAWGKAVNAKDERPAGEK
ncbi:MAG: glycosyltransferase family 39 protein [Candidatus Omnitrophica bacterium]|nr:glycosyltransferase family 39 protein [Candidatus Omnitrophota bacterium]